MNNIVLGVTPGPPCLDEIKSILVPRQLLLKFIDRDGTQSDAYVLERLRHKADEYERYVNAHKLLNLDVEAALALYEAFYHMT